MASQLMPSENFARAVRIMPNMTEARFNLGISPC